MSKVYENTLFQVGLSWPLTVEFERATWPFLMIDRQHKAYLDIHEKIILATRLGAFLKFDR